MSLFIRNSRFPSYARDGFNRLLVHDWVLAAPRHGGYLKLIVLDYETVNSPEDVAMIRPHYLAQQKTETELHQNAKSRNSLGWYPARNRIITRSLYTPEE